MIDFEEIENGISHWLAAAGVQVQKKDQARAFTDPTKGAQVFYSIPTVMTIGRDGIRGGSLTGTRAIIVSCAFESMSQEPNESALFYGTRADSLLRDPEVLARLRLRNLSLVGSKALVDMPHEVKQRARSKAVLDVEFNTTFCVPVTDPGCIESMELRSEYLVDSTGAQLPNQINTTIQTPE